MATGNRFLEVLEEAREKGWCMSHFCTTCGAMEFRSALWKLGDEIADDLASLDLDVLEDLPTWDETIRFALDEIKRPKLMDQVLMAWQPQLDRHIRVADVVLFYYVRRGALFAPMSIKTLEMWRDQCVELAIRTRDESLVDSLICTVGHLAGYPELVVVIRELAAQGSRRITTALRRNSIDLKQVNVETPVQSLPC